MERLSGLDASFVYAETPAMHMHVSLLAVLDPTEAPRPTNAASLETLLCEHVCSIPAFRRRLLRVPFDAHHPLWIDDPHFDALHHIRRVACPQPAGMDELADLVARIDSTPLDRARPLWELWLVDGLPENKLALVIKVHHAVADGMSGANLLVRLLSASKDALPPASAPLPTSRTPLPSETQLLKEALRERGRALRDVGMLFRRTRDAVRQVQEQRQGEGEQLAATPFDAPRVYWNAPITGARSVAFAKLSLADLKLVRKAFGVTLNDVVLAVCAGALRKHLERTGRLPLAPLIAGCPVAERGANTERGGNHVSAMFTSLATNLEQPVDRLMTIANAARHAKEEHGAFGSDIVGRWAELVQPAASRALFTLYSKYHLSGMHRPLYNVAISNVPGPPIPIYLAGCRVLATYPLGPVVEGVGLNITVMSYVDQVDVGLTAATAALPDVAAIAEQLSAAAEELVALAHARANQPQTGATDGEGNRQTPE